jgi:predicted KAP-like P-loop ATPase
LKHSLRIFIVFLGLVVIRVKIEDLITRWAVQPFFGVIKANAAIDLILLTAIVSIVVLAFEKARTNYLISSTWVVSSILIAFCYAYYRVDESLWVFERFSLIPQIAYFDLILLLPVTIIILYAMSMFRPVPKALTLSRLVEDNPWEQGNEDLFNRKPAATRIAKIVLESKTSKSFAIGVCADWGDGKSSFIHMIKDAIPANGQNVIIEFSPWFSQTRDQVIEQFFNIFRSKLAPFHLSLSSKIGHYSNSLSTATGNLLASTFNEINNIFNESESVSEERDSINDILKTLDKRIIVFIDDVDRLDSKEIMEVLKLIRNSANFHNLFFIVAFDREYVKEAIKKVNPHNVDLFLEKIFQLEIRPPAFDKVVLKQRLTMLLAGRLPRLETDIKDAIYGNTTPIELLHAAFNNEIGGHNLIDFYILNLRDVVRLVNLLSVNYSHIEDEVVFKDFFYVQLILLKSPQAYHLLAKNPTRYLKIDGVGSGSSGLTYSLQIQKAKPNEQRYLIQKDAVEIGLTEIGAELLVTTLKLIFGESKDRPDLSVKYQRNFYKYFGNALFEGNLSESEFKEVLNSSGKEKVKIIEELASKNKISDLENKIRKFNTYESEREFLSFITAWVVLMNINGDRWIEEFLLSFQEGVSKLKLEKTSLGRFFESLFNESNETHFARTTILRDVLRHYIKDNNYEFVLDKGEIQQIALSRLRDYCQRVTQITETGFEFYYNCFETIDEKNTIILIPEASKIILNKIYEDPQAFIKFIIRPLYRPHDGHTYVFEPFIPAYFGSWDQFLEFIQLHAIRDENVKEIVAWYFEFKKRSYENLSIEKPVKWLSYNDKTNQFEFIDVPPRPLTQEQIQIALLEGTWRNEWIAPDTGANEETASINSNLQYSWNNQYSYDLKEVSVDLNKMTLSFEKVGVPPNQHIRLRNDLKIESVNFMSGIEHDTRDGRDISIKYTRLRSDI